MPQAISAGHEITLAVAKEILQNKGNAFDAAIAAHYAMFITEPCMASAGGSGFALTRTEEGETRFFDFFCQTPLSKKISDLDFYPVLIHFGSDSEEFHIGLGSAAVPGSIAGLFALHKKYGSIPMRDLVAPATQLAKEGVALNDFQAYDLELLYPIFSQSETGRRIFFNDKNPKQKGETIQMPQMADFLDFIAREGERGFYHGEIAKVIAQNSTESGGFLTRADFEKYQVNLLDPLKIQYKNHHVHLPNGPSKGGAMMAIMLSEVHREVGSLATAIEKTQIIQREEKLSEQMDKIFPPHNFRLQPSVSSNRGTSHFNILDRWGNAISFTCTIGEGSRKISPSM
ncbi:MAG: gamma-glutamyltransferase, partial [Bacteroidota bacterium]